MLYGRAARRRGRRARRTAGRWSRSPCAWRRWSSWGSSCPPPLASAARADRGDRGAVTRLRQPARALWPSSFTGRVAGVRLRGARRAALHDRGRGRPGAGEVAARELRGRADPDGRRRPPAGSRRVRGPLPVRPRAARTGSSTRRSRCPPSDPRSRRWPPSTTRRRGSSARSSISSASWPRAIPIPGRSCATRSGRRTTSPSARTPRPASSTTTARPSRSAGGRRGRVRDPGGAGARRASSSPATSASASWARRSST